MLTAPIQPTPLQESPVNLVRAALDGVRGDETGGKWVNGFAYLPELSTRPGTVGPCSIVALADIPGNAEAVTWQPYIAWTAVRCSTAGFEAFDWLGRAQRQLEMGRAVAIEREFWSGELAQADPTLASNLWLAMPSVNEPASGGRTAFGPIDLTPAGGPVTMKRAFGMLEQSIADYGAGSRGMIHVRPEATPNFTGVRREGNLLLTNNDTIVVPGNGYPNIGPGGVEAAAGNTWLYSTGLVEVRVDPQIKLIPDPTEEPNWYRQALDTRTDTLVVYAQQFVVASWDGQVHFAVQAVLDNT